MRTTIVIFTDKMVSRSEIPSFKKYKFLCNYDTVSIYDIIADPRYTSKMMVVGFDPCTDRVQGGVTLKDIYITEINGYTINQPAGLVQGSLAGSNYDIDKNKERSNMEEKRNIKVTLEQAMEWYNSGNSTLRTLALSAYTEDELKLNFQYISNKVCNTCVGVTVPANDGEKHKTLADLAIIAKYFNGDWKKTTHNIGYCISIENTINGSTVEVYKHESVKYPGIIYFKNREDVTKAIKILGKRIRNLCFD